MILKDQLNNQVVIKKTPKRIVSLVPSQTELLYDLGLEDAIVGITKFCVHPNTLLKTKTIVGGTKQIHIEKIKQLKPDIILCNKEENTQEIVRQCQEICTVHVSDIVSISDCIVMIKQYGEMFDAQNIAKKIAEEIAEKLLDFKKFVANKPKLKVAYFIWKNPWMVAANNTFINHLLQLNNFENEYGNYNRYPEISLQENKNLELVFLSSEPFPFKRKHISEISAYYPNAKIQIVDGEMFSWYGSRLVQSFQYFKMLH